MAGGVRLRPGDVLELPCGAGYAYLAYVGRHPTLGDTIWVVPKVCEDPSADVCRVFAHDGYYAFYPAHAAARQSLIRKAAFCTEALRQPPTALRQAVNIDRDGSVRSWLITDGKSELAKRELTSEEQELPIAAVWNHELLVERILQGWHPRDGLKGPPHRV